MPRSRSGRRGQQCPGVRRRSPHGSAARPVGEATHLPGRPAYPLSRLAVRAYAPRRQPPRIPASPPAPSQEDAQCRTRRPTRPSRTSDTRTARSPLRRSSPPRRTAPRTSMRQADEDYEAFWAEQARTRLSWSNGLHRGPRLEQRAVREVVRRRRAQRRLQLRRPPRRGRQRRQGGHPLRRRARGRHPRHHVRRPARARCSRPRTRCRTSASARATPSRSTCR